MSDPSDRSRLVLTVLLAFWAATFAFAFSRLAQDRDPGMFLGWQGVAGVIAFAVYGVSRQWPKGTAIRSLGRVPVAAAALVVVGIVAVSLWAP